MTYTYPNSWLDAPSKINSLVGDFWGDSYVQSQLLLDIANVQASWCKQNYVNMTEAAEVLGRIDIPIYHKENWYTFAFNQSAMTETGGKYTLVPSNPDTSITKIAYLSDKILLPNVTYRQYVDYTIDASGNLVFNLNPFEDDDITKTVIFDSNSVSDNQIKLFAYHTTDDNEYPTTFWGYILGMNINTSENYKTLLNGIFDAITEGTSSFNLLSTVSGVYDIPITTDDETIIDIVAMENEVLVCGSNNTYSYQIEDTATFAVGDTVIKGTGLTDSLRMYDVKQGQKPLVADITGITITKGILPPDYTGNITFPNANVATSVTLEGGYNRLTFPLDGDAGMITKFWADVSAREDAEGVTLYSRVLQKYNNIPATVNPMNFLLDHFLHKNVIVISIDSDYIGDDELITEALSRIETIATKHLTVLLLYKEAGETYPTTIAI